MRPADIHALKGHDILSVAYVSELHNLNKDEERVKSKLRDILPNDQPVPQKCQVYEKQRRRPRTTLD